MHIGEDLELAGASDVVAIARGAVGDDLIAIDKAHLLGLVGGDHAVFLGHLIDPSIGLNAHCSLCPLVSCLVVGARGGFTGS